MKKRAGRGKPRGNGSAGGRNRRRGAQPAFGALDLGTNNCRLLVARPNGSGFSIVTSYSRIVRLGEGLARNGRLSEAAMERTLAALRICADKLGRHNVARTRGIATEACRQAENCAEFLDRVREETGLELETISSVEEARLALAGCQSLLDEGMPHALVFDIGGGSTEFIWAGADADGAFGVKDVLSLPLGVLTLAERNAKGPLTAAAYDDLVDEMAGRLGEFSAANGIADAVAGGAVQMLGTSGTVTTLGAVHLDLPFYSRARVDGLTLGFDALTATTRRLVAADQAARAAIPCIGPERTELMLPGCAIVEAICRSWPVGRLRIADRGLREGMLLDLMADAGHRIKSSPAGRHRPEAR